MRSGPSPTRQHAWTAYATGTIGHDLAIRQMPVAYQPLAAVIGQLVGMATQQGRNLGLDRLRQQCSAPLRKTSVSGSVKVPRWER